VRCSAPDRPLTYRTEGQTHCDVVWRRRRIVQLDSSELNLRHGKWHGAEAGFEYRASDVQAGRFLVVVTFMFLLSVKRRLCCCFWCV